MGAGQLVSALIFGMARLLVVVLPVCGASLSLMTEKKNMTKLKGNVFHAPARCGLFVFLSIAAVLISGCESPEEKVASYLASAQELYDQEDFLKAELEAKNALQIQPKNAAANFLLAEISETRQDFPQMAASLRAAIESKPDFTEARVKLATLYALGGAGDRAQEQLDDLKALNIDTAPVKVLAARLLAMDGDLESARMQLEAALDQDPSNSQALGLLASIAATKDLDAALELIERGIEVTDNARPLRLLRLQLLTRAGRTAELENEYRSLIADYPDESVFGYQYARFLVEQGQIDDVEQVLRQVIERQPDEVQPRLALTQFIGGAQGPEAAEKLLRELVADKPDMLELRNALAQYLKANGRIDDAFAEYEIISQQAGNDDIGLTARAKLAGIYMLRGELEESENVLNDILLIDSMNIEALILRGAMYTAQKDYRDAVSDFRNALRKDPQNKRAQLLLAQAHKRAGDSVLAKDAYRRALEAFPDDALAPMELAKLLIAEDNNKGAEEVLRDRLAVAPQDGRAVRALIALLRLTDRMDNAKEEAQNFSTLEGQAAVGQYLLGALYLGEQDYLSAEKAFRSSLDAVPLAAEPIQGLVLSLVRSGQSKQAKAFLKDFTTQYPENLWAKTLLGQVLAGEGDTEAAAAILESTLQSDESWLPAYTTLAGLKNDDVMAQIDVYKRGLEALPGSQELALLLGTAYERNGRIEEAIAVYENALESNANLPAVANNLAALLADYRTDKVSYERALTLAGQFESSDNPAFVDTLGWIYYRVGDFEKAIRLLEDAVDKAGQVPVLSYHLGMAYFRNGQAELAKEQLQAVMDSESESFIGFEEAKATFAELTGS
jgi:tetratricopeptide (TPR) repeat protein